MRWVYLNPMWFALTPNKFTYYVYHNHNDIVSLIRKEIDEWGMAEVKDAIRIWKKGQWIVRPGMALAIGTKDCNEVDDEELKWYKAILN